MNETETYAKKGQNIITHSLFHTFSTYSPERWAGLVPAFMSILTRDTFFKADHKFKRKYQWHCSRKGLECLKNERTNSAFLLCTRGWTMIEFAGFVKSSSVHPLTLCYEGLLATSEFSDSLCFTFHNIRYLWRQVLFTLDVALHPRNEGLFTTLDFMWRSFCNTICPAFHNISFLWRALFIHSLTWRYERLLRAAEFMRRSFCSSMCLSFQNMRFFPDAKLYRVCDL